MRNNKTTDWDIKRCFQQMLSNNFFPSIFIDEYWDYYMKEFCLEQEYETFKKQFNDSGINNYREFQEERLRILKESEDIILKETNKDDLYTNLKQFRNTVEPWAEDHLFDCSPGQYVVVDLHSAWDQTLKLVGLDINTQDIINGVSKYDLTKDRKVLRMDIYNRLLWNVLYDCQYITSNYLLKKVKESNHPIIQMLNDKYTEIVHSGGDMYMYKVNDEYFSNIVGDYEIDGISFSISVHNYKEINILGQKIMTKLDLSKPMINYNIGYTCNNHNLYPELYPLAYKLLKGEQPTEKDLAVGYEDKIYFYLNENDYEL